MTAYYVYDAHAGAGDAPGKGADPSTPFATLKYCIENADGMGGAPSSGDIVYVDYRHTEDPGAAWSINFSSKANITFGGDGVHIVSADFDNATPETYRKMTASDGYLGGTSGGVTISADGFDNVQDTPLRLNWHGIRFHHGQGGIVIGDPINSYFRDCIFNKTISSGAFFSSSTSMFLELDDCVFSDNGTTSNTAFSIGATGSNARVIARGCVFDCTTVFYSAATYAYSTYDVFISDSDLTLVTGYLGTISFVADAGAFRFYNEYNRCKTASDPLSMNLSNNVLTGTNAEFLLRQCSNTDITATALPITRYVSSSGEITSSDTAYFTSNPGDDGENNYSLRYAPGTLCSKSWPLGGKVLLRGWHPGGNANLTVRFSCDDATLTDEEVYLVGSAPGHTADTGSSTIGRRINTRAVFGGGQVADTSSVLLTDTDSSWTGGGTTEYKFVVPVNATEPGYVEVALIYAKSTTTQLWVSPVLEIA